MMAEVVVTPIEGKKLIAKGVWWLPSVQRALRKGIIAIHPSSTTYFLMEEMGWTPSGLWLIGVVREKGLCVSWERQEAAKLGDEYGRPAQSRTYTWVIENGRWVREARKLDDIVMNMGPGDVYIKGCNALDCHGRAGVLFANKGAGTIGFVKRMQKERGFSLVLPVGLEKLIPVPLGQAVRAAALAKIDWSMGQKVGLLPLAGDVVTEDRALAAISGAEVTPIAAGGLISAQGSSIMVVKGDQLNVEKAVRLVQELKGVKLPAMREPDCKGCSITKCCLRIDD